MNLKLLIKRNIVGLIFCVILMCACASTATAASGDYLISVSGIMDVNGVAENGYCWNGIWSDSATYTASRGATVTLQVKDLLGNVSAPVYFTIPSDLSDTASWSVDLSASADSNSSVSYSFDGGLSFGTTTSSYTLDTSSSVAVMAKDEAGNKTPAVTVNRTATSGTGDEESAQLISRVEDVSGIVLGPTAYIDSTGSLQAYGASGGLQVTFDTIPITGQYVVAYAELMGNQFPVTWSNDEESGVTQTTYASTGTFVIDPSETTTSRSTALTINVIMYDDATLTTQTEADSLSMYVVVDMSAPVVSIQYNQYSKVSEISVRDVLSGVESIRYTLSNTEGTTLSSGTSSAEDFTLSVTESGYITVIATDAVGNEGTTVSSALSVSSTTSGGTTIPDVVAPTDETTTTSIYHYKTTLFDCYLINGKYNNVN